MSPSVAASLSPTSGESDAMLFGRVAGDVITIVLGAVEVGGGVTIAGGGAAVGCGTTLCLASAPAAVPGLAVATYGVGTTLSGASGLGENLGRVFSSSDDQSSTDPKIKSGSTGGQTAGKPFSQDVKNQAFSEDPTHTCVYCGRSGTGTQVDHVIPRSLGGNATIDNAQLACPHCNASKGARNYPVTPPTDYRGAWPPRWWDN